MPDSLNQLEYRNLIRGMLHDKLSSLDKTEAKDLSDTEESNLAMTPITSWIANIGRSSADSINRELQTRQVQTAQAEAEQEGL